MRLPQQLSWDMAANRWASMIEPVLNLPPNQGILLKNVALVTGTNVINHRLGRPLQGWEPTRKRAAAEIYDDQDNNQMPQLTLVLVSDADVTIDLWVF